MLAKNYSKFGPFLKSYGVKLNQNLVATLTKNYSLFQITLGRWPLDRDKVYIFLMIYLYPNKIGNSVAWWTYSRYIKILE